MMNPGRRRAVVVGATGHVGNAVVRQLLADGWDVTAASRRPEGAKNLEGLAVTLAPGDADTPGQVDAWTAGQQLVVDAATPYPLHLADAAAKAVAHVEARAKAFTEAARRHGATLAHVSSFVTLPAPRDPLDAIEAGVARALHPYFAVKERAEAVVLAAAKEGLPVVVVNPTLCLGPWDLKPREATWIPQVAKGEIPVTLHHVVNVVDVRDVAAILVRAVDRRPAGRILASGHDTTFHALCRRVTEAMPGKVAPPAMAVPSAPGLAAAIAAEVALSLPGVKSATPALGAMLIVQHESRAPSREQRDLGVVPRPAWGTVVDSVAWYRSLGYC